jgi:hypothetical protein
MVYNVLMSKISRSEDHLPNHREVRRLTSFAVFIATCSWLHLPVLALYHLQQVALT